MKTQMQTNKPFLVRSTSHSIKKNRLHQVGYEIIKHAVEVEDRVVNNIQKACTKGISYVFNHNETNSQNDHKRLQRSLPVTTQYMQNFDQSVRQVVQNNINTTLTPTDPVILHSRPGCQPQAAHCDYVPDAALKAATDEQIPLAAIVSLMPETHLKVWPNSVRLVMTESKKLRQMNPIKCQEVVLGKGDIIVFRGDFIHAGSGYQNDNYRVHYYLDSPVVSRAANRTYLVNQPGNQALSKIIDPQLEKPRRIAPTRKG